VTNGNDPEAIIAAAQRYAAKTQAEWVENPEKWLGKGEWKHQPSLPSPNVVPSKMSMEEAVAHFAKIRMWSRHAPVSDPSQAPPELMAKYGMMPDGRKLPKEAA
jgi:hypothetical protein